MPPVGYLNDRVTRTIFPDPDRAPLVAIAGQKQVMLHNSDTGALLTILAYLIALRAPQGLSWGGATYLR